jgi:chorismate mutase
MVVDELREIREKISQIDDSIIALLIERFKLTDEVGRIKKLNNIPIENKEVEEKILAKLLTKSNGKLDNRLIAKLYNEIFLNSKNRQKKI